MAAWSITVPRDVARSITARSFAIRFYIWIVNLNYVCIDRSAWRFSLLPIPAPYTYYLVI
jgi:hypothetical protein